MITKRKHIKNFAAFFLAFYSLFILYAALHTHGVHTYSNFINIEERHHDENNHPFLDSDNNCRLVSFANSLYTSAPTFDNIAAAKFISTEILLNSQFKPFLTFKESLQLRAPPSVS